MTNEELKEAEEIAKNELRNKFDGNEHYHLMCKAVLFLSEALEHNNEYALRYVDAAIASVEACMRDLGMRK